METLIALKELKSAIDALAAQMSTFAEYLKSAFQNIDNPIGNLGYSISELGIFDEPTADLPKYDPFDAVSMWKHPVKQKTPDIFIRYNQMGRQRPLNARRIRNGRRW